MLAGLALKIDSGYVLLAYHKWTIEMPLWFAIVVVVILFLIIHYCIRLWIGTKNLGKHLRHRKTKKRFHKAHALTGRGLLKFIECRWAAAEKLLLKGVKSSSTSVINYLWAARAAQEQGESGRCEKYIEQAYKYAPKEEVAIGLVRAELQIKDREFELALATLRNLQDIAPKHSCVLQLLKSLYIKSGDWEKLLLLLPKLKKNKLIEKNVYDKLEAEAHGHLEQKEKVR